MLSSAYDPKNYEEYWITIWTEKNGSILKIYYHEIPISFYERKQSLHELAIVWYNPHTK